MGGGEHLDVVVAITGGEGLRGSEAVQPRDFRQSTAFLVVPVAEAEIDRVPLPAQLRHLRHHGRDVTHDPFHLLLGARDQPGWLAIHLDVLRAGVLLDLMADFFQHLAAVFEEFVDILLATLVPIRMRQEAPEVVREMDLALAGDHPIRQERKPAFDQTFHDMRHRAASIDAPHRAPRFAQAADLLEKLVRHRRSPGGIMQCPVEIEGKDQVRLRAGVEGSHAARLAHLGGWARIVAADCIRHALPKSCFGHGG